MTRRILLLVASFAVGCASIVGIEEVKKPDDDGSSSSSSSSGITTFPADGTSTCSSSDFNGFRTCTTPDGKERRVCPADKITCETRNGIEFCGCAKEICGCP